MLGPLGKSEVQQADLMRTVSACAIAAVGAVSLACASGTLASVRLQAEQPSTLHIGEIAAVELSERQNVIGSGGNSLVLLKRTQERGTAVYFYRAVTIGDHTILVAPEGQENGQCISCVTEHYFIRVVE